MGARMDGACRAGLDRTVHAVIVPLASILLATSPAARASPCDDYKAVLEERFEASGVRGYSLELIPANDPVPPGTKVIATCEGGARKFVYRRWAAAGAASSSASSAAAAAEVPARRVAAGARQAQAAAALPASAPALMRVPDAKAAKPAPAAPIAAPLAPLPASAVAAARPIEAALGVPPPPVTTHAAAVAEATPKPSASDFAARQWQWIAALALGALVAGVWLWRTRFSAYDKDGLPRGPRL